MTTKTKVEFPKEPGFSLVCNRTTVIYSTCRTYRILRWDGREIDNKFHGCRYKSECQSEWSNFHPADYNTFDHVGNHKSYAAAERACQEHAMKVMK